ncbi:MAG: dihydroorotate dehydrogenase, partial [Phycisphaerae bacterium]|nr:dihydroorotate dehydrogenase [Gemmatimonadaceae bacterium]
MSAGTRDASPLKPLGVSCAGLSFRNPVLLASGTAGFGAELEDVMDLSVIGGLCTKAVSVTPRKGNPALRVSEFAGGMINAVGLANPGLDLARREDVPYMGQHHPGTRVLVNVVGNLVEEYAEVVAGLDDLDGVDAFELNVSCPNVKKGGLEFGADPAALAALIRGARAATKRPLFVKLSPTLGASIGDTARAAVDAGADAITLVNTLPGMVIDVEQRKPKLS